MSALIFASFVQASGDLQALGAWWVYLLWIPAAALLGFASAGIFAGLLHLPRRIFLIPYVAVVSLALYIFMNWSDLSLIELLQHNWFGSRGAALVGCLWFATSSRSLNPGAPQGPPWCLICSGAGSCTA